MTWLQATIFILILHKTSQKLQPPQDDQSAIFCILTAIKEFQHHLIFVHTRNSALLEKIQGTSNWSVIFDETYSGESLKANNYLVELEAEVSAELNHLQNRAWWNPRARFIFVTTTADPSRIFKELWTNKVVNAVVVQSAAGEVAFYSWCPFSDRVEVLKCSNGSFGKDVEIFSEKIPKDLNGFVVKARAVVWPPYVYPTTVQNRSDVKFSEGIEISLLNTIAQKMNFRVIYSLSEKDFDWGNMDDEASGMMATVLKGEADIGFGGVGSYHKRHKYFESSTTYFKEVVTWCIPRAKELRKWKCLLVSFKISTWVSIIIIFILTSLAIKFQSIRKTNEHASYRKFPEIFLTNFSILLGVTIRRLPKSLRIRILIMSWAFICLNVTTFYQSTLISLLTNPIYEDQPETYEELLEAGYSFGIVPPLLRFFEDIPYKDMPHWERCFNVAKCLDRTAFKRDLVVVVPRSFLIAILRVYIQKGEILIYWPGVSLVEFPVEMIMTKGFFLLERINEFITRIKETGLILKWIQQFLLFHPELLEIEEDIDDDTKDSVILTVQHLEGAFIFLGIGLGFATMVFVLERLFHKSNH